MANELYDLFAKCFTGYRISPEAFGNRLDIGHSTILTREAGGETAGFSVVSGNALLLLCVGEEHRRQGIGTALLKESENRIREAGHGAILLGRGSSYLLQGVPDDGKGAIRFFEKHGYAADSVTVDMDMDLNGYSLENTGCACPDGVAFRYLRDDERPALLSAVDEVMPDWRRLYEAGRSPVYAALEGGNILGFCMVSGGSPFHRHAGSVGCVGVVPAARRRGVGLAMVARATQELKDRGYPAAYIGYTHLESWYAKLGYKTILRFWMGGKRLSAI